MICDRPHFGFTSGVQVKGFALDGAWVSSRHMSDPSPPASYDDGAHAVLVTARRFLVGDGLASEYLQDFPKVLGIEGGEWTVEVNFSNPPAF